MSVELILEYLEEYKPVFIGLGAAAFALIAFQRWRSGGQCRSSERLDGKTVIITGANTGIGKETARELALRGAKVILACRDYQKAVKTACELGDLKKNQVHGPISVQHLDLASFDSIRQFVSNILRSGEQVDILINNAGLCCAKETTADGFDLQFQTNYLGPFLLTNLLLDRLKESAPSRIINVSSRAHFAGKIDWEDLNQDKGTYEPFKVYRMTKLANVLFTKELARRLEGTGVATYSVHPGLVSTDFLRYLPSYTNKLRVGLIRLVFSIFSKNAKEGAQTTIYCAVSSDLANQSGLYYSDCAETKPSKLALKEEDARRLWNISAEMIGLKTEEKVK